jgi:hypothetical protein
MRDWDLFRSDRRGLGDISGGLEDRRFGDRMKAAWQGQPFSPVQLWHYPRQ